MSNVLYALARMTMMNLTRRMQAVRAGLRVRDWINEVVFVRNIDWKSPQRQRVLKDDTGWRKVRRHAFLFFCVPCCTFLNIWLPDAFASLLHACPHVHRLRSAP